MELFARGELALNVLDLDGGVVDENTDREGKAAQRHDVDRFAKHGKDEHGRKNRQGNRDANDERAAPTAEKDQDEDGGQTGRDQTFAQYAKERGFYEDRLVGQRKDLQL